MAKDKEKDKSAPTLAEALTLLGKQGCGVFGTRTTAPVRAIPTGSLLLDRAIGCGGYPRGRIVEVFGPESCLDGDTYIQYAMRRPDGRRVNHKGGTLRRLWERFNRQPATGTSRGKDRRLPDNTVFTAPSINEDDRIFHNEIVDVVRVGSRPCWKLITAGGHSIIATADHRFFTGSTYVKLCDLSPGDVVLVHASTPFTAEPGVRAASRRGYLYVRQHPIAGAKVVSAVSNRTTGERREYVYHRLLRARAVVEAHMNGVSLQQYVELLNSPDALPEHIRTLSRDDHVHHLNEDEGDDRLENLVVLSAEDHGRMHALDRHNNLRFVATEDIIRSIEPVGVREVFDVKMLSPFNNYIAANFVTHNSGKTTLAIHALANVYRNGGKAAFIDAEHAFDPGYAAALGVPMPELIFSQPDSAEQALDQIEVLCSTGQLHLIVIDSVAALVPQDELDGDMGDSHMGKHARLMSQACRKLTAIANRTGTALLFLNQIRMKIGIQFGNPETTPGGNALKFFASCRLDIRRIGKIEDATGSIGNQTRVKVVKNKMAPPFKEAEFGIIWGKGIDTVSETLTVAIEAEVIKKTGNTYTYKDERIGVGLAQARAALENNADLFAKIAQEIAL
jgi:recombination protein RecA